MLRTEELKREFQGPGGLISILNGIDFELGLGESAAILGPSGSGKSTFLSLAAGLDHPTSGRVWIGDVNVNALSEGEKAQLRLERVGFVFQTFRLLPSLTAQENVALPLELKQVSSPRQRALDILDRVGLSNRAGHFPHELSGGEQQRVALARAFGSKPSILFADEPTGNLDPKNAEKVANLLFELNQENKTALLLITHDQQLAGKAQSQYELKDGLLFRKGAIPS